VNISYNQSTLHKITYHFRSNVVGVASTSISLPKAQNDSFLFYSENEKKDSAGSADCKFFFNLGAVQM
jgi:hypothetical protein